jgi:hypothetical protein
MGTIYGAVAFYRKYSYRNGFLTGFISAAVLMIIWLLTPGYMFILMAAGLVEIAFLTWYAKKKFPKQKITYEKRS